MTLLEIVVVSKYGGFLKMDAWGVPPFMETPICFYCPEKMQKVLVVHVLRNLKNHLSNPARLTSQETQKMT